MFRYTARAKASSKTSRPFAAWSLAVAMKENSLGFSEGNLGKPKHIGDVEVMIRLRIWSRKFFETIVGLGTAGSCRHHNRQACSRYGTRLRVCVRMGECAGTPLRHGFLMEVKFFQPHNYTPQLEDPPAGSRVLKPSAAL